MSSTGSPDHTSEGTTAGASRGTLPTQRTPTPSAFRPFEEASSRESSPPIRLSSSTSSLGKPTNSSPGKSTTAVDAASRPSSFSSSLPEPTRPTSSAVISTVVKTAFITETQTRFRPAHSAATKTTAAGSARHTVSAVDVTASSNPSSTYGQPSQSSNDPPPASQASAPSGRPEEHPPLTNGATAGIVLAVVAVLLGTFFLVRYIYKRRGFCGRSRPFSPIQEPYDRPTPGPISGSYQQHPPGLSWILHPEAQFYPSVVVTPSREDEVELQTFTRPMHGPRMYDVGHSGNAPLVPAYSGHEAQGQVPARVPPPQNCQDMPISPESPTPSAPAQDGDVASPRSRAGALPWEEDYRYRAW